VVNLLTTIGPFAERSYLIPLLPLLAFGVIGLLVNSARKKLAHSIAIAAIFGSLVVALGAAVEYYKSGIAYLGMPFVPVLHDWLSFSSGLYPAHSPALEAQLGILLDPISITLTLLVCAVSLMVQIYSIGYLHGDDGYRRFFAFISLFTGAMLGLVLSPNILQTFVFWELVALGSFLLIGYYYYKPEAVSACKKAFIVTRFADLGFLVGILLLSYYTKTFDYIALNEIFRESGQTVLTGTTITVICLLITAGAFGKSAMFPLHIWLPDAMEGPTPVSALIHAATMVVAGVYLIARLFGLFLLAPEVLQFIAALAVFTSLFAAVIACTQNDIKRVLAFSTLSQIGYMMLALASAKTQNLFGFSASMFHLSTHAFFKALLFLAAGAIIHAAHTNNVWEMGGLRKKMPLTHVVFLIGCLAIAGVWPFSGFYSKDDVLLAVQLSEQPLLFWTAIAVAGLTAFYMFRIYYLVFWGPVADSCKNAQEPALSMRLPLIVLALGSIAVGWLPFKDYVFFEAARSFEHPHLSLAMICTVAAVSILGWFFADLFYRRQSSLLNSFTERLGVLYRAACNKFYIDELYLFITKRIIFELICRPLDFFDRRAVDGSVNGAGFLTVQSGTLLSLLSTGRIYLHLAAILIGVLFLIGVCWIFPG